MRMFRFAEEHSWFVQVTALDQSRHCLGQLHPGPPTAATLQSQGSFRLEASVATMLRQIITQAKKHPSLIPLFVFIGAGGTGAALYVTRLALFNPDVSWDRKNNPEPWNKLGPNDQYKFFAVNVDYSKLKKEGPDF